MHFHKYSAPYIFDGLGHILEDKVIIVDHSGTILSIEDSKLHDHASVLTFDGAIVPGFINTHCHLELSHMKGKVQTGTTLLPFIHQVVSHRDILPESILDAIEKGDKEMYQNGIVAVGDISNKVDTVDLKNKSKLFYHTFVEMFDFLQDEKSKIIFDQYADVFNRYSEDSLNRKSIVPHAPYSVSRKLFNLINEANLPGSIISIHNQETVQENLLFKDMSGQFPNFYKGFGIDLEGFEPLNQSSMAYNIANLDPNQNTIFVHNTETTEEDILLAMAWNKNVFWASCPNANLYIENRLPRYDFFISQGASITLGTDSLTSNWQLSIAAEIYTILKYCSYVSFEKAIVWATSNGASALGLDDRFGSITLGMKPGLNGLNVSKQGDKFVMHDFDVIRLH
jgi:cytosine/adenosine deaminase-related metal-dependent hydrolase